MDVLKSLIPDDLKRMISESTPESLPVSCSSLLEFLLPLPPFQRVLRELTDPEMGLCRKSMEAASDSKRKGNECFSRGDYSQALSCYSQALRFAPMNSEDTNKDFMAMLHVNRAASMLKLGLYEECRRDCNRAIVLSPLYVKAWYRRAKADAALKNYEDAICDLEIAMNMEGSLSGKKHLKEELEMAVSHSNRETNISSSHDKDKNLGPCGHMALESIQLELQSVSTPAKGRGMASINSIPPATLVHYEAPFAVIVLKHCRETHCHFCLNELPADAIFCPSCTTASYCSHHCLEQARGTQSGGNQNCNTLHENFSPVLKEHVKKIVMANNAEHAEGNIKQIPEHMHECGGVNWPAVLPPDAVLAGRVLAKSVQKSSYEKISKPMETTEFVHNYTQTPPESKLVLHIYAVVLSYCLHRYFGSNLPFTGASSSQLVILMSQIKVNSMAVVHMRSFDGCKATKQSGNLSSIENALTCNIEQVRVGQAIYSRGRLFNHSCRPNIHAYFLSRTLFLRSTEFVPAGCPLELSYGPQVGQLGLQDRKKLLQDQYSFKCQCSGCSEINLSDIVIHAFRCVKPNCFGAVLESNVTCHEHMDDNCLQVPPVVHRLELSLPVNPSHVLKASQQKKDGINKVAHLLSQTTDGMHRTGPGYCLSCGSYRDLECSNNFVIKAWINIQRLQDSIISNEDPTIVLSDALESLNLLRSTKHAYSKDVAQAEDIIAEAFCLVGQFDSAQEHCKASIEILENLYHINHIVIGHELVKLASIQISLGDRETAIKSINRLEAIFSLYYGLHVAQLFPYLESLANGAVELTH